MSKKQGAVGVTEKRNPETWHLEEQLKVLRKELDAARIAQATRLHVDLEHFGDFENVVRWTIDGPTEPLLAAVRLVRHTSFPLDQRDMAKQAAELLNDLCAECDKRGGITEHRITQE